MILKHASDKPTLYLEYMQIIEIFKLSEDVF